MRQIYSLLFVIITIAISCNSQDDNLYKIDPRNFIENKITLSDIADDALYVPLDNGITFGTSYVFKITNNHIYLSVKDVGILKFDRAGKFVCMIGRIGRGPGEHKNSLDFAVDEGTGNVYVMVPGIIKVYSQSGRFIRDIMYNEYIDFVGGDIDIYNSMLFIPDYLADTGTAKYNWIFLDTLGNLVANRKNTIPPFKPNTGFNGSIYKFGNKLFYYNIYNDTIFSISPDLSSKEAYLFAKGDHRWPIGTVKTDFDYRMKLFRPGNMFETKYFIVFTYAYLENYALCFIEKKTKKTFLAIKYDKNLASPVKSRPSLLNDLDGGMPLSDYITFYTEDDREYIAQLVDPYDLKVYSSTEEYKNIVPKYPQKKEAFEKFVNSIKETDNPILMMVRLKK